MACKVCLLPHDPEIHAATLRIREYFREELRRRTVLPETPEGHSARRNPMPRKTHMPPIYPKKWATR